MLGCRGTPCAALGTGFISVSLKIANISMVLQQEEEQGEEFGLGSHLGLHKDF